jgi:predicted methyltransferase
MRSALAFMTPTLITLFMTGCSTAPRTADVALSPDREAAAATAAAIESALANAERAPGNADRDEFRHPKATLMFMGLRRDMTVVEVWPGGSGWYTEILAPVLRDSGKLYAAQYDPALDSEYVQRNLAAFRDKLTANPALYDQVATTVLSSSPGHAIAPAGSADLVLTFRNVHNWLAAGWAPQAFSAMFEALKPGGILGVVEHRGNPSVRQDPKATSGYVNEAYVVELARAAGFELLGASEINANPRDTKDYEAGVWTLPPTFRLEDGDRARYQRIGESDRMTLKFVKPGASK